MLRLFLVFLLGSGFFAQTESGASEATTATCTAEADSTSPLAFHRVETAEPDTTGSANIPRDLEDCFRELKKTWSKQDLEQFSATPESEIVGTYHSGAGLWMRNNWGLWTDSRLAAYFQKLGVEHPDDMSGIILLSFWRHLHKQPLRVGEQVEEIKAYWKMNTPPARSP